MYIWLTIWPPHSASCIILVFCSTNWNSTTSLNLNGCEQLSFTLTNSCSSTISNLISFLTLAGASDKAALANDVAIAFLKTAVSTFHDQIDYSKKLAAMMFPLLLIFQKVFLFSYSYVKSSNMVPSCLPCYLLTSPSYTSRHRA